MRGAHCLLGCVLTLVLLPLYALIYSAFGIVAVLRTSVGLQLVELPFLLLWPWPTANAAAVVEDAGPTSSGAPSAPVPDADASLLQGIVTDAQRDAEQLQHTSGVQRAAAATHLPRATGGSGQQQCRGRPMELLSLLLVAVGQGLVLIHLAKYMQLHFPGSSIALAVSLHVVSFFVAEYLCNVLETDVARYLNVKQIRTVRTLCSTAQSTQLKLYCTVDVKFELYNLTRVMARSVRRCTECSARTLCRCWASCRC